MFESIWRELPNSVMLRIFKDFLYPEFLESTNELFKIPNYEAKLSYSYYNFSTEPFREFMLQLMLFLEIKLELENQIIVDENGEWMEVIFFNKGLFGIGFSINKEVFLPKIIDSRTKFMALGAYPCMYHKKALFLYKTLTVCEGLFIRKRNWIIVSQEQEKLS